MTRAVTIAVIGEADSGKSSLLAKFLDPATVVQPASDLDEWRYFDMQEELPEHTFKHTTASGNVVDVTLIEVPGSRGRMGNWFQLGNAFRRSQAVIVTDRVFARSQWNPIGKQMPFSGVLERVKYDKHPLQAIYVATGMDTITDDAQRAELMRTLREVGSKSECCRGTYFTSAVTNEGVREAISAAVEAALYRPPEPVKKPSLLHKLAALFTRKIKTPPAPVASTANADAAPEATAPETVAVPEAATVPPVASVAEVAVEPPAAAAA